MAPEGKKRNTPHTETSSPKKRRCNDDGSVEFARSNADFWINEAIRTARLIDKLTADKKNAIEKAGEWEAETTLRAEKIDQIRADITAKIRSARNKILGWVDDANGSGPGKA